jgi:hypothetical protein
MGTPPEQLVIVEVTGESTASPLMGLRENIIFPIFKQVSY